MIIALAVVGFTLGGVSMWHASRLPAEASSEYKARLQRGVGSEVRFAAAAKPDQIGEMIQSVEDFIHWRSALKMSDEMKGRLAEAEGNVMRGKVKPITLDELTDTIASAVEDRLGTLTDQEIREAAEV